MSYVTLPRVRRASQIVFFALFLLHLRTEFLASLPVATGSAPLPYPVSIFLQSDLLVAISNAVSTRALYKGLLWSLTILIPTLFLGRFFCGWICPLGALNHFFSYLKSERKRGKQRIESNHYKRWQTLKYYLLIALLVSALFGGQFLTILDPISLTVRSLGLSLLPGMNYGLGAVLQGLLHSSVGALRIAADGLQFLLQATVLNFKQPYFRQGFFLGLIFIIILALNLRITRFWCRALCPLGALLGVLSRWSIFGLEKHADGCEDCNRCLLHCQGGDDPIPGVPWRKAECHLCFNCVAECPKGGIKFKFFPGAKSTVEGPNLTRRRVLTSAAAGAAALPLFRIVPGLAVQRDARLIRPPGALDEKDFLNRCVRCGECMKACPNDALHPTLTEAGLEGIWTPTVVPRIGYCEPSCVLCSQVCPTGAIWKTNSKEKGWVPEQHASSNTKAIRIGTAFFDRGRCLPWAMATQCIVCEEWCPTSPKAIYLRPAEVVDARGKIKQVMQPYLDAERCVGCGACEFACPVQVQPAVYVTSIGESRSPTNQILLRPSRKRGGT
ncbi:MAG TPA: 4Fe-4S dicluster domain-containing protein [Methylomirabilota bacterium]|nr:4Fe-4S dicluster domain-containing protein [Methylomirabilota bacterium]